MPITILITLFALLTIVVSFGIAYKVWGVKTAVITALVAFLAMSAVMVIAIMVIANSMPN